MIFVVSVPKAGITVCAVPRVEPSVPITETRTGVTDACGLKTVTFMIPSVSGPNGTMSVSEATAGDTVSKRPDPSERVATVPRGPFEVMRRDPLNEDKPNAALVNLCWDCAGIFWAELTSVFVLESTRLISAVTALLPRLFRMNSDPELLLKSGKTY